MLKTLHAYLTRDLVKVALLSLVAFTLGLTVLAIIQPMRKEGLSGEQIPRLFIYTLPTMLSLTLPVATLLAATLVYGRFSQDNELLACRASGVPTVALLGPALGLGVIVTLVSLLLSNVVAPSAATLAGLLRTNARGVLYHKLRSRGYIDFGSGGRKHVIHADAVDAENDTLYGVVYAYVRKARAAKPGQKPRGGGMFLASATAARLSFPTSGTEDRVIIQPLEPSVIQTGEDIAPPIAPKARTMQIVLPLPNPIQKKASWYSWRELREALSDAGQHGEVQQELEGIRQLICSDILAQQVTDAVTAGKSYSGLAQGDETYEIEAAGAEVDDKGAAVLKSLKPDGRAGRRVTVIVRRNGRSREMVSARTGRVAVAFSPMSGQPYVTLKLSDDVRVNFLDAAGRLEHRPAQWLRGEVPLPADIRRRAEAVSLSELAHPKKHTRNEKILERIKYLAGQRIPRLRAALVAEMHARAAYGLSCFLMVAMGAALGLIFRGGQFISAFAISFVPAAIVIAMLVMGKEMVRNPGVSEASGLACIWGGIVALLAANVLIYLHLARK